MSDKNKCIGFCKLSSYLESFYVFVKVMAPFFFVFILILFIVLLYIKNIHALMPGFFIAFLKDICLTWEQASKVFHILPSITIIALTLLLLWGYIRNERRITPQETKPGPHDDDKAIDDESKDELEMREVAKGTANYLANVCKRDGSLVLGINGRWGSGKTSFFNLARKQLKSIAVDIEIIDINPWAYISERNQPYIFMEELGRRTGISSFRSLSKSLRMTEAPGNIAWYLSLFFKTPEKYINDITERIAEDGKRYLVVIDDIDRMTKSETRGLLALFQNRCQIQGVHYLILCHREQIEFAFQDECVKGKEGEYVEKLFYHFIDLPTPTPKLLLNALMTRITGTKVFGETGFAESDLTMLLPFLKTMRNVKRIFTNFEYTYHFMGKKNFVNVFDLLVLECLRHTVPEFVDSLYTNRTILNLDKSKYTLPGFSNTIDVADFNKNVFALIPDEYHPFIRNFMSTHFGWKEKDGKYEQSSVFPGFFNLRRETFTAYFTPYNTLSLTRLLQNPQGLYPTSGMKGALEGVMCEARRCFSAQRLRGGS